MEGLCDDGKNWTKGSLMVKFCRVKRCLVWVRVGPILQCGQFNVGAKFLSGLKVTDHYLFLVLSPSSNPSLAGKQMLFFFLCTEFIYILRYIVPFTKCLETRLSKGILL